MKVLTIVNQALEKPKNYFNLRIVQIQKRGRSFRFCNK